MASIGEEGPAGDKGAPFCAGRFCSRARASIVSRSVTQANRPPEKERIS